MKTCVIFNPVARGQKAGRFRHQLAALAAQCALKPTGGPGQGRALAAEAVRDGYETIVAAGGDGTLNEVLNGIGDVPNGFERATLALLPLGTVNVFARELRLPSDPIRAWGVVQAGRTRRLDVVTADFQEAGNPVRRFFIQMAGAGFDARAVELVNWEHKKLAGPAAYVLAGLKAMRTNLPKLTVTVGNETGRGQLVLIGNGRYYGGRFVLFPQADPADGLLDVTIFPEVNWRAVLRCGWNVVTLRSPAAGQAIHLRGRTAVLACQERMPFQVEGENSGHLPVCFSVHPDRVRVIVP